MLAKEGVLAGAEAALAQTAGDVGSRESHTVGRQVRLVGGRHDPVYEGAGGGMVGNACGGNTGGGGVVLGEKGCGSRGFRRLQVSEGLSAAAGDVMGACEACREAV
jgi:hypothetical protein